MKTKRISHPFRPQVIVDNNPSEIRSTPNKTKSLKFQNPLLARNLQAKGHLVFPVKHQNGLETMALIPTMTGLEKMGITEDSLFEDCVNNFDTALYFNMKSIVKDDFIVNLHLPEQLYIIDRMIEKYPMLRDAIGHYNLHGALAVCRKLKSIGLLNINSFHSFWTGELDAGRDLSRYSEPSIITTNLDDNQTGLAWHYYAGTEIGDLVDAFRESYKSIMVLGLH